MSMTRREQADRDGSAADRATARMFRLAEELLQEMLTVVLLRRDEAAARGALDQRLPLSVYSEAMQPLREPMQRVAAVIGIALDQEWEHAVPHIESALRQLKAR